MPHSGPRCLGSGRPEERRDTGTRISRHAYCAARLQTLDGDAPVSPYTVSRELGHGSLKMVEEVYSHLGTVRHQSAVVEARIEPYAEGLHEQLERMGIYGGSLPA